MRTDGSSDSNFSAQNPGTGDFSRVELRNAGLDVSLKDFRAVQRSILRASALRQAYCGSTGQLDQPRQRGECERSSYDSLVKADSA